MINRYNIALIPASSSELVINCAQNFSHIYDGYLLGTESLPHVTLYNFCCSDLEIRSIFQKLFSSQFEKSINLKFTDFSCITIDRNIHWVSLVPDKTKELSKMHGVVTELIGKPVKVTYDPHMTLMNTKKLDYQALVQVVKSNYIPIEDTFVLSIGRSDNIGQYLSIIYTFKDFASLPFLPKLIDIIYTEA